MYSFYNSRERFHLETQVLLNQSIDDEEKQVAEAEAAQLQIEAYNLSQHDPKILQQALKEKFHYLR